MRDLNSGRLGRPPQRATARCPLRPAALSVFGGFSAFVLTLCPGAAVEAQTEPAPLTSEIQVNTYTSNDQESPSVCVTPGGDAVVVWDSSNQLGLSGRDVFGQRLAPLGTSVGTEFQINVYTTGNQDTPRVSCQMDGGFIVVWESGDQDGDGNGVFGRVFSSSAVPETSEIQLNAFTTLDQGDADVAAADDGSFIAIWESLGQDGNSNGLHASRFLSDGTRAGNEFQVNTYTTGSQQDGRIARTSIGEFVIVFEGMGHDGDPLRDVFLRRFDAGGNALAPEERVNAAAVGEQQNASVATDGRGGFVIVWQGAGQDGSGDAVRARRFSAGGVAIGPEFQVNTYTTGDQDGPAIAVAPNGGFSVAWEGALQDGSDDAVVMQSHDATATPEGGEIIVNENLLGAQRDPTLAAYFDTVQVVWRDAAGLDGGGGGIFARRFDRRPADSTTTTLSQATTTTLTNTTTTMSTTTTVPIEGSCGDADDTGTITASDALRVLRAAVGTATCALCVCDVESSGSITATDALRVLRFAVGLPLELSCPAC